MSNNKETYEISTGPSRDAIIDHFKYLHDKDSNVKIEFFVIEGLSMPEGDPGCAAVGMDVDNWHIHTIQHEDGSGHSFNLEGWCCPKIKGKRVYADFKAYYSARTRKGTITFIVDDNA